jgi:hypothetical protein
MNKWGIPEWLENEVRVSDKTCVYCGIKMIEKMPPTCTRPVTRRVIAGVSAAEADRSPQGCSGLAFRWAF